MTDASPAPAVDPAALARRAQIVTWIADSRRVQQRLRWIMVAGAVASVALGFVARWIGVTAFLVTVGVGVIGYWVTAAHISDWQQQLDRLERYGKTR